METPTPDPHSGIVLDARYVLGDRLRSDASGSAYLAHDRATEHTVVVTVMHSWLVGDQAAVHAFEGRAQNLGAVSHPDLARFLGHGRDGDRVYAVNEYLPGETLGHALGGGGLRYAPHAALKIVASVLAALDAAHAQGLVHGGLVPERVVVDGRGGARLTGFPLLFDDAEDEGPDTRTDVRAVGLLLYMLITGERVAFDDARPLRPSSVVEALTPDLDMLVANATDPNPRYRPRDAGQYLTLVEQVLRALDRSAARSGADDTRPIPIAASNALAVPSSGTVAVIEPDRVPLWRRVPVLVGVGVLIVALFAAGWTLVPAEAEATLPDVTGATADEAEARLEALGLNLVIGYRDDYHDTVDPGGIAGSVPGPGSVVSFGDEVLLSLSVGPRFAPVPDVIDGNENEARDTLREAGFTRIEVVQEHSSERLPGTVLATEPEPGAEGDREEEVVVHVSEGIIVPSLDGLTGDEAADTLVEVGLTPVTVEEYHETVQDGDVSGQDPEPGSILPEEGRVTVTLSLGPDPEEEEEEEEEGEPSESPSETSSDEQVDESDDDDRDDGRGNGHGGGGPGGGGGGGGGGGQGDSCSAPSWDPGTTYDAGDRVSHQGREYEARWWNRDSPPDPDAVWGPWSDLGRC
ncbi:PASTA domain-containing protein [Nocardiopsis lambiniae]|uniref:non-specific serine/threonine protein kinase n=1 Tax=Nocardiopsis lambiniae TaxID=3075539 RepID=A0ABU2MAP2_9ACTN|nr:PASTA domain-containing protein [Nocardiopsis sp. DSM 44743]MDT0329677.1 PASTA domain-containing protein [Nocardiopsis sp. DSM 44743]